jgi:hypothetical protein
MSPSAKGSPQVLESSNNNPNLKNVITPPVEGSTEHQDVPAQPAPQIPEHRSFFEKIRDFVETRRGKVTVGIAGAAIAASAAGGVWAANSGKAPEKATHSTSAPSNQPSHTTEASPSATPKPEATTVPDTYNYGVTQADIAPLLASDDGALNTGTVENKATLAMFYAQTLPAFAENWASISKNPKDAMLPAKVSADNTPDEINAFLANAHRQAVTISTPDYALDKNASDKVLASSFINGTLSPAYKSLSTFSEQVGTGPVMSDGSALAVSNYLQLPIINKAGDKYTDAAGRTCIDMNVTQNLNGGAAPITEDITACMVTNPHGSIWMQRQ